MARRTEMEAFTSIPVVRNFGFAMPADLVVVRPGMFCVDLATCSMRDSWHSKKLLVTKRLSSCSCSRAKCAGSFLVCCCTSPRVPIAVVIELVRGETSSKWSSFVDLSLLRVNREAKSTDMPTISVNREPFLQALGGHWSEQLTPYRPLEAIPADSDLTCISQIVCAYSHRGC